MSQLQFEEYFWEANNKKCLQDSVGNMWISHNEIIIIILCSSAICVAEPYIGKILIKFGNQVHFY